MNPALRLLFRAARSATRKLTGKNELPRALVLAAHQPRLPWTLAHMESTHAAMSTVSCKLKSLATLTAARRAGCPF